MRLFAVLLAATAFTAWSRTDAAQIDQACFSDGRRCTSRFGGYKYVNYDLTDITTQLVDQSFDFLFLSAAFKQYDRNRPGFEKLYRNIADRAWSDAIAVMQYQSRRGHLASLNPNYRGSNSELRVLSDPVLASEHSSLQLAMEYEKQVASMAHAVHKKASVAHQRPPQYDPDVAHFLDRQLVKGRSDSVRKLTGYIHMLDGILNVDDATPDLGLRLFDDYLKSQE
ncbi:soma ferritin-like [Sabethes cyaneus]|uniref:soma ferritin-like n=1 Tax=Sabethes cyaneus TaxID=53552 RepID=UPI00237D85B7|nr:soma ferritin-like [Sabethes cyaneus]